MMSKITPLEFVTWMEGYMAADHTGKYVTDIVTPIRDKLKEIDKSILLPTPVYAPIVSPPPNWQQPWWTTSPTCDNACGEPQK